MFFDVPHLALHLIIIMEFFVNSHLSPLNVDSLLISLFIPTRENLLTSVTTVKCVRYICTLCIKCLAGVFSYVHERVIWRHVYVDNIKDHLHFISCVIRSSRVMTDCVKSPLNRKGNLWKGPLRRFQHSARQVNQVSSKNGQSVLLILTS